MFGVDHGRKWANELDKVTKVSQHDCVQPSAAVSAPEHQNVSEIFSNRHSYCSILLLGLLKK